jgi:hypothetical protein
MTQKRKNIGLMIVLVLLILVSFSLAILGPKAGTTIKDRSLFAVQDTSFVHKIIISSDEDEILLEESNDLWTLNNKYTAEQNIVRVLLSILRDTEVVRNVPKSQQQEISEYIEEHGYLIEIFTHGSESETFYVAGNENKTVSYMMSTDGSNPKIVNIPGYDSYVAGIFEIPENDWRDRTILSTNWRTLQKLEVIYSEFPEHSFVIEFKTDFLNVDGVQNLDTAQMMSYIQQYNYLQVDRYLDPGQHSKYDSLLQTPETVRITVTDVSQSNSKTIRFFPLLPNDNMMLGFIEEDEQMALFQATRIQSIFAVKEEFEIPVSE